MTDAAIHIAIQLLAFIGFIAVLWRASQPNVFGAGIAVYGVACLAHIAALITL
ncbi:hypothetical protein [Loktanella sp. 3ANDIMAR09]|uniref:hypothetical protein n=1 Tax=Loktanella sp. 3ANDIMAR09 TaxID=1225657 RepID=UPI000AF1167D|nr:hypothetical protein [Loktanella sp. 3ANDIMAR09]